MIPRYIRYCAPPHAHDFDQRKCPSASNYQECVPCMERMSAYMNQTTARIEIRTFRSSASQGSYLSEVGGLEFLNHTSYASSVVYLIYSVVVQPSGP
jgi:hypothetical protein